MKTATLADGTVLHCGQFLGAGAAGSVYRVKGSPHVVKIFKDPTPALKRAMQAILGDYNTVADSDYWRSLYCWPDGLVIKPSLGVRLPAIPGHLKELGRIVFPKSFNRLPAAERPWAQRLGIAVKLARAVGRLHRSGFTHSDLSPANIYVDPRRGELRIIDLDGLVVRGHLPPQVIGTPEYIAPEALVGKATPSSRTDLHALAVIIYQLLLYRHPLRGPARRATGNPDRQELLELGPEGIYIDHPTNRKNRPRCEGSGFWPATLMGASLADAFETCFVAGLKTPATRVSAGSWESYLVRLADRVVTCGNPACKDKHFPLTDGRALVCPWCRTPYPAHSGVPALRLMRGSKDGKYRPEQDWWLAGIPGRKLYNWHVRANASPMPGTRPKPLAEVRLQKREWCLVNLGLERLREVRSGRPAANVPLGSAIPLRNGTTILTGDPPEYRALYVQVVSSRS